MPQPTDTGPAAESGAAPLLDPALQLLDAALLVLTDLRQPEQDPAVEPGRVTRRPAGGRPPLAPDEPLPAALALGGQLVDEVGDLLVDGPDAAVLVVSRHACQPT